MPEKENLEERPTRRLTPDEVVARIRVIGEGIRLRNVGKEPLLKPGESYRDLAHKRHRF